ncbi:MAG: hypothetical protein K9H61_01765 [Bacteroidia bacterium]|nr:hypothetical protein [Bacteroidia bacterium]MCF8445697.1 hypothetical protein [Bacteroidia bacterium]
MKILHLFFIVFGLNLINYTAKAQYEPVYQKDKKGNSSSSEIGEPKFYFGLGTGLHYKMGLLGISAGYKVAPNIITELNLGIGGYGSKVGITTIFNAINKNAWCPMLGFSRASGFSTINTEVEVVYMGATTKTTTDCYLDQMITLNTGIQRQFVSKRGNRFALEMGFAFGLNKQYYGFNESSALLVSTNTRVSTNELTFSNNQKAAFKLLNPAGLMLGLSYNFGFK